MRSQTQIRQMQDNESLVRVSPQSSANFRERDRLGRPHWRLADGICPVQNRIFLFALTTIGPINPSVTNMAPKKVTSRSLSQLRGILCFAAALLCLGAARPSRAPL